MIDSLKKVYQLLPAGDNYKLSVLFVMMLIASVITVAGIGMVPVFVTLVIDSDWVLSQPVIGPALESYGIATPQRLVIFGAAILIIIFFLKDLYMVFYEYLRLNFMLNRHLYLQNRLFNAYMRSKYTFFIRRNSSELLRNVGSEVSRVIEGTLQPVLMILLNLIMTVVIITGLMFVEPLITVVGIVLFGTVSYLYLKITKTKIRQYGVNHLYIAN
jgi:ABC-type multidrug transport system fused ATPase/permease subunit